MKTTILGLLGAGAFAFQSSVQHGASIIDWKTWLFPVVIALLGYHTEDVIK
jgi:hypothetical protein